MLGMQGVSLKKLLKQFAPEFQKLEGPDFEGGEEFDSMNPAHCDYAMRDSQGLYHAMDRAQKILIDNFDEPLAVTMGGACIKIFAAHIPADAVINPLEASVDSIVREYVMRGGYCFHNRRYEGPIWKYDLNQAYAAAMRDAMLPAGTIYYAKGDPHQYAKVYMGRVSATRVGDRVPFYYRTEIGGRLRSVFTLGEIRDTWLTSIEIEQLRSEGWRIEVSECYWWHETFNMRAFVDKLEILRMNCEGGPSGPTGTMVKAVGNHSYGKTLEALEPIEVILSAECPDGWEPYYGDGDDPLEHVYFRLTDEPRVKAHHQPHIGAFITAAVRMVVRRAALLAPESWLYTDTDCVIFDRDMSAELNIHPTRYGAWKIEESGAVFRLIAKKVYAELDFDPRDEKAKRHAKGLNVRKLAPADFERWYQGEVPAQNQIQINNFLQVVRGLDMYRGQRRRGTAVPAIGV